MKHTHMENQSDLPVTLMSTKPVALVAPGEFVDFAGDEAVVGLTVVKAKDIPADAVVHVVEPHVADVPGSGPAAELEPVSPVAAAADKPADPAHEAPPAHTPAKAKASHGLTEPE